MLKNLDNKFIGFMNRWGMTVLRLSLGIVFLWFGLLKLLGESPVLDLVQSSYDFLPFPQTFYILGAVECFIGIGLLFKTALKISLGMLWLMLAGTFISVALNPTLYFTDNILYLTTEGEFVIKNIVLIAAGLAIGGSEFRPK